MTTAYRLPSGWVAILALSMLAAACAKQPQPQQVSAANAVKASGADRQGHFERPPTKLDVCVAYEAKQAFPDLVLILNASPPQTLRAMSSRSKELNAWTIEFHEAGSGASDVILRSAKDMKSDVDRIWGIVEACAGR